ncbi:AAA domain-containing protein, putative AbiEii toxin, Type IV TA system [Prosthecobacter debontii]|uniref:AAA domain-containing protein, putative AbiEii toxin, Type IV TA system n=1 Tax=Prosthecobacter debontii TaxID=48467 RepID=A0A1T4YJX0_9BACT|nr:ATP-binding protein [Prosthecobacter debontii]SKB01838.1 AAA domain-containing protein, putative AbiEii toxin, Type IV TA system [Prosthecobacter debontii]
MPNPPPFRVIRQNESVPSITGSWLAYLNKDRWDDWGKYCTQFYLTLVDPAGTKHSIGNLKIGQRGLLPSGGGADLQPGYRRPDIPEAFHALDEQFFSLGQENEYYANLRELGPDVRKWVLGNLRDVAFDAARFEWAKHEDVMGESLLRSVSTTMVEGQYRRIAHGGVNLTPYHFSYAPPLDVEGTSDSLSFSVIPDSVPPTNVQVIIGRNGVGKTRLLSNMTKAVLGTEAEREQFGEFTWDHTVMGPSLSREVGRFSNVVLVSFSAFDSSDLVSRDELDQSRISYSYVGLRQDTQHGTTTNPLQPSPLGAPKTNDELADEFVRSLKECQVGSKLTRWKNAMKHLEYDLVANTAGITNLIDTNLSSEDTRERVLKIFDLLSSGHKIILLTLTRLVQTVEEQTLVLMDEPESYLHPPLLSAFVRALSELLVDRNGVAIVATHSPVVLQEVPRSCVWVLRRVRHEMRAEKPGIETFGENVGSLTREVFGLDVKQSGYMQILKDIASKYPSYDQAIAGLNNQLGTEARVILRSIYLDLQGQ